MSKGFIDIHELPLYDIPFIFIRTPFSKKKALAAIDRFIEKDGRKWLREQFSGWWDGNIDAIYGATSCIHSQESGARAIILTLDKDVFTDKDVRKVLGHELQHVVIRVFEYVEMPINPDTGEAASYLSGYLHKYCAKRLKG